MINYSKYESNMTLLVNSKLRGSNKTKIHVIRVYHGMIGNNHDKGLLTTMIVENDNPQKIHEIRVYHGTIGNDHND